MKVFAIILISLFSAYIVFSLVDIIFKFIRKKKSMNHNVSQSSEQDGSDKSNKEV